MTQNRNNLFQLTIMTKFTKMKPILIFLLSTSILTRGLKNVTQRGSSQILPALNQSKSAPRALKAQKSLKEPKSKFFYIPLTSSHEVEPSFQS